MAKKTVRKIELFALHAHKKGSSSYEELFQNLLQVPANKRVVHVSSAVIGLPIVRSISGGYLIQATEGDPDAAALVFNQSTGRTRETALGASEILSQANAFVCIAKQASSSD
jgi:hypothetical protein